MNDFLNQVELVWDWLTSSQQWHGDDGIPIGSSNTSPTVASPCSSPPSSG